MFTGIVEDIGTIEAVEKQKNLYTFSVLAPKASRGIKLGESVSVDGVCLTVSAVKKSVLFFDLMKDTLDTTTLGAMRPGTRVNLERALQAGGRFGGHVVTGHVDGSTTIIRIVRGKNYIDVQLSMPKGLKKLIVTKGSITLNGISLTVGKVLKDSFFVSLIPFTMRETTMSDKKAGDRLNIEADILARYILSAK
jgi:riboflavin synthase